MKLLLVIVALVIVVLAVQGGASGHTPTSTSGAGTATVVGTAYARDSTNPTNGTHYADCRNPDGTGYRVVITAAQDNGGLHAGDPCPAGAHLPLPQDEFPDLWNELTKPLPYNGGDANGPCGSWAAADKADADQMQAHWQQCMATHH